MRKTQTAPVFKINSPLSLAMGTALLLCGTNQTMAAACSPVANTITVTSSLGDNSAGTLLEAINSANESSDCNQIEFHSSVTSISLESTISAAYDVNIIGHGANLPNVSYDGSTAISTSGSGTNLYIANISISNSSNGISMNSSDNSLELNNVIIEDNVRGIYIYNAASIVTNDTTFTNNALGISANGYAYVDSISINDSRFENHNYYTAADLNLSSTEGNLTITNSKFENNSSSGGTSALDIWVSGADTSINITNCTFDNNTIESSGSGAINIDVGVAYANPPGSLDLNINNTTFSNNIGNNGGGLTVNAGIYEVDATITQSTFSGNTANGGVGGGLRFNADNLDSSLTINSSTFFNNLANTAGGGIYIDDNTYTPEVNINNTVIANNEATESSNENIVGEIALLTYSWLGDSTGAVFVTPPGNDSTIDGENEATIFDSLADNGGLGLTHLPSSGSPLIDAGDPETELEFDTDQNGLARISNGVIDIGATEVQVPDDEEEIEEKEDNFIKTKSSSGAIQWLLLPLSLLGLRRKRKSN